MRFNDPFMSVKWSVLKLFVVCFAEVTEVWHFWEKDRGKPYSALNRRSDLNFGFPRCPRPQILVRREFSVYYINRTSLLICIG